MSAEIPGNTQASPPHAGWRQWLGLAGAAVAVLVLSEVVWIWQTWPVRELLQAPVSRPAVR